MANDKSLTESSSDSENGEEDAKREEPPKIVFKSISDNKNSESNPKKEETKYAFPKNPFLAQG